MTDTAEIVLDLVLADSDADAWVIETANLLSTGNGLTAEDLALPQPSQNVPVGARVTSLLARLPLQTTPAQVIAKAATQVGTYESPADSNNVLYSRWYGLRGPWCAMFLSWVFDQCGADLGITTSKGFAYCPAGVEWFKAQGRFVSKPQVGAIVFYQWADQSRPCHVGLVYQVDSDGTIWTIEGNTSVGTIGSQSNGGIVARRHRTTTFVVGYGLPDYTAPKPVPNRTPFLYLTNPPMRGLDVRGVRHALRVAGNVNLPEGDIYDNSTAALVNLFNDRHHITYKGTAARGVRPGTWVALRQIVHGKR